MPSIMQMARAGRNGDTTVAHMTPGEMVVPKEVAAMRPDLVAHIQNAISSYGTDPSKYVVGGNARTNPTTGAQEFATSDEINAAYQQQFGRDATAADQSYWGAGDNFANGFGQAAAAEKATAPAPASASAAAPAGMDPGAASTYSQIYGGAAPPPAPAPSAVSAATPAPAPASSSGALDWNSIYRNVAGRDADPASLAYQQKTTADVGDAAAYQGFLDSLKAAGEVYNPNVSLADASKAYAGPTSAAGNTSVDEWARNALGRAATPEEIAKYGNYSTPDQAAQNYTAFVAAAQAGGGTVKELTLAQASQLSPADQAKLTKTPQGTYLLGSPTPWNVTPEQTVEGRINNLVDPNSPIIQQAQARAMQAANGRGLLNSSIATTAGQSAAYDAAIPIATADAATFAKAAGYNADESNQFAAQNANFQNTMAIQQFNADTQKQLQTLSAQQQADAAKVANANQTVLQSSSQASQAYNQIITNIANINASTQLDSVGKQIAVAQQYANLQSQLNMYGATSGLNLGSTLNFANLPGFDAQGVYRGINPDGTTAGSTPAPLPAAAPVAAAPAPVAPGDGG